MKIKSAPWIVGMAMLALSGTLVTSCSKEMSTTEEVAPKGDQLVISVVGINNAAPTFKSAAQASAPKVYEFADVDMAIVENHGPAAASPALAFRSGASAAPAAAPEAVAQNVKYVVYIYEGTTYVASALLEAGTAGTITGLDPSKTYNWKAVSYNNETTSPVAGDPGASLALPENTDVLYAQGTVNLATDPTIAITFNHVLARIGIELNTIGVFGNIANTPTLTVEGAGLSTGTLDLATGNVTANSTSYTSNLTYANFTNVDPAFNDAKIAYVYTASTTSTSISLTVKDLQIEHVDKGATGGNNTPVTVRRTFFATPNGTTFPMTVTPVKGQSKTLTLNVIESALTTNLGRKDLFGNMQNRVTVKWGRSNLYYRGENGPRSYGFYAQNKQSSRADGFFAFEGTKPMRFVSTGEQADPCALVYPAGVWKSPTADQINSLTTSNGVLSNVLGGILDAVAANPTQGTDNTPTGANYAQYDITAGGGSTAFDAASNNLRFYYNGQITNANVLTTLGGGGLANIGLSELSVDLAGLQLLQTGIPILGTSAGQSANLWTYSRLLSGPLLSILGTSVGSQGYLVYESAALIGGKFVKATTTAELLGDVNLLGLSVVDMSLKNVRCVRVN